MMQKNIFSRIFFSAIMIFISNSAFAGEGHHHHHKHHQHGTITLVGGFAKQTTRDASAAFMVIKNSASVDDYLLKATTDSAKKTELHTHIMENNVMKMREVESMKIPAQGSHHLKPGSDHIMFFGLGSEFKELGKEITLKLEFKNAGTIVVTIPIKKITHRHKH